MASSVTMNDTIALYPTARKIEDLLKRSSREGTLLDYPVTTLPQLIDRLWREFGPRGAILDDLQERLAVAEAIAAKSGALLGSTDHVAGLIRQFKSAGICAEDLRRAADTACRDLRTRIEELADAFESYERLLKERGVCDRHDRERAVLDRLIALQQKQARPAALAGVRHIRIAEIYDFSLLQFMIVSALIRIVGDATLTIQAAEHPAAAERFPELTWNRFVAEETIADLVLPAFVRRGGRPGRLGFVLEHLFIETSDPAPRPDDTIEIVPASTPLAEIEKTARAIRLAMESPNPIAPERIAVVARDLAPYAAQLRSVFTRYGIPLKLEDAPALRASAPARAVLDVLHAPRDRFSRESLASLCRSPNLKTVSRGLVRVLDEIGYVDAGARPLMDRLDSFVRDLQGAAEKQTDEGRRGKIEARLKRIEQARPHFERILDALAPLVNPGTLDDHLARLRVALNTLGYDPAANFDLKSAHDDSARAAGPVLDAIDGIARWAELAESRRTIEPAEFARIVENAFDCAAAAAESDTAAGVAALPVLEARGLDFDLVFVIGLNDGLFPRYYHDDPLLPDEAKRALNGPLREALRRHFGDGAPSRPGSILRTRRERNAEDFFLFFLALSMPSRRVVLSYAATEAGGNPIVRSPFVDEVLRLLGDGAGEPKPEMTGAQAVVPEVKDCFSRDEFLARAALSDFLKSDGAQIIADAPTLESICSRSEIERKREDYLKKPAREENTKPDDEGMLYSASDEKLQSVDAWNGRVACDERLARLIYGDPDDPKRWSATQINQLACCGYRYFAARVLGLSEDEDQDYELSALESGEIIHEVLKQLVDRLDFSNPKRVRLEAPAVLDRIGAARRAAARDPAFFDLRWNRIEQTAMEFIDYEIAYREKSGSFDIETEYEFDFSLARPKGASGAPLRLGGRIDRLEIHRHGNAISRIRVLDYKDSSNGKGYGNRANPDKEQFGWTDFQLAIYLMAAIDRYEIAPETELEAGYYALRDRDKENREQVMGVRLDLAEIDPRRRARLRKTKPLPIADRIVKLIDSAAGGEFDVDPRRCDEFCEYRTLCRYYKTAEK
jgi:superfamily I DNA/RNA helicase